MQGAQQVPDHSRRERLRAWMQMSDMPLGHVRECEVASARERKKVVKEQWKRFPDTHYLVSNRGRVKALSRTVSWMRQGKYFVEKQLPERLVKVSQNYGYPSVTLWINGKFTTRHVHRLVALAFLGPCPRGKQVNHKDGDKANPKPSNLEYLTPQKNHLHAMRNGLIAFGERHGMSKLTARQVKRIKALHGTGVSQYRLAKLYKVSAATVWNIVRGLSWRSV